MHNLIELDNLVLCESVDGTSGLKFKSISSENLPKIPHAFDNEVPPLNINSSL